MPETKPREKPTKMPVTQKMCDGLISFVNIVWQVSPFRDDALDEIEQKALSKSLYQSAKSNVFIGNLIYGLMTGGAEAQLLGAIAAVAVIRLAKHHVELPLIGALPEMIAIPAYGLLTTIAEGEVPEGGLNVAAGGTLSDLGINGNGQDGASGKTVPDAEVRDPFSRQAGYASLAEFQADQDGGGNGFGQTERRWVDPSPTPSSRRKSRSRVSEGD